MGIKSFIKKQFIDILQWTESDEDTIAWRFPTADMEIQYGGSLTVRESQAAVFVNEGKVADVFAPGMHKLSTQTLPVLTYLKNWDKLFESPFKSEVYFFSTRTRVGRKWGTPQAITIRDKDFGAAQIRAFGQYAWRVADVKQFFSTISGTREVYRVQDIEEQLRGTIVAAIATAVGASGIAFLDLAAQQSELARRVREEASKSFEALGLALEGFELVSLTLPEALQEALDTRIRMGMIGNMSTYTQMKSADAIAIAAGNEGGAGVAGMAAQMAVGMGMGQMMQQSMGGMGATQMVQAPAAPAPAWQVTETPVAVPPAAPAQAESSPKSKLLELKGLLDAGLIDQAEFDSAKQAILAKLTL